MKKEIVMSVHQLVDFLLRRGDIDNRIYNQSSMMEGSRLHFNYQEMQKNNYLPEVYLSHKFLIDDFEITLQGRADGIIKMPFINIIDEIKTTVIDLEEFYNSQKEWHLGQAKVYALIHGYDEKLDKVGVRLTYISQIKKETIYKNFTFTIEELEKYVEDLIREFLKFYELVYSKMTLRNESAKVLEFPFSSFRKGQRELSKYAYSVLNNGGLLYSEAPTGIGKTMSTLFPAVKTFANEENEKIFYLTAKNSGSLSAYNTSLMLIEKGLDASLILITAKDKICFSEGRSCNPDECPYAKGYYDKIRHVLTEAIESESIYNLEFISDMARKHCICPFEFELDLSLYTDIIVCDFNYLFDPLVHMKRYFDNANKKYIALIDEAHNLVERSRGMYTTSISYKEFLSMYKTIKNSEHKKIKSTSRKIKKFFKNLQPIEEEYSSFADLESDFIKYLNNFYKAAQNLSKNNPFEVSEEFKTFFFSVNKFLKIYDYVDDNFTIFINKNAYDITINIYCLDSSRLIKDSLELLKGAVLFSGTLSPLEYYVEMLGGNENSSVLKIPSPFPSDNFKLLIANQVSTTFKNRDKTYVEVSEYIKAVVNSKIGNYLVFFPSYAYLDNVVKFFESSDFITHIQSRDMAQKEKEDFLENFKNNPMETHVGFAVLGGSFSEGIDLQDSRLIGAIIVGVGLPQISYERSLIANHFDGKEEDGFSYAYTNPGMNRVMQAAGRVIRSERDKGIVLLIDERYTQSRYKKLFKSEWSHYEVVKSIEEVKKQCSEFWSKREVIK